MGATSLLGDYMNRKINMIQKNSNRAAILARLRRAAGKEAGSVPDVWEFTLDLPETLVGKNEQASPAENAVSIALSLYAVHQQGKMHEMHREGAGNIGKAAARLKAINPESEKGIKRRFDALATARGNKRIENHARGIVQLLKAGDVDLDYVMFACDLFLLQSKEFEKDVLRRWGRDFYNYIQSEEGEESNDGKNNN
jgi:CRISPR system Cascade subunit CasB